MRDASSIILDRDTNWNEEEYYNIGGYRVTIKDFNYETWESLYDYFKMGCIGISAYPFTLDQFNAPKYVKIKTNRMTGWKEEAVVGIGLNFSAQEYASVKTSDTARKRAKAFFKAFNEIKEA